MNPIHDLVDLFRPITNGTVIGKHDYAAIAPTPEHFVGTGKTAILAPAMPGADERYSVTVRGTARPGGRIFTHEIYLWGNEWYRIKIGDAWPQAVK